LTKGNPQLFFSGMGRLSENSIVNYKNKSHAVTADYPSPKKFNGEVNWVEIDIDKDAEDLDHLITPEERLRVAMAIQ
jgi:hypothetical protein